MAANDSKGAVPLPRHKMLADAKRQFQGHVLPPVHGRGHGRERAIPEMLPLQQLHLSKELRRGLERENRHRDRQQIHVGHHPPLWPQAPLVDVWHTQVQQQDTRRAHPVTELCMKNLQLSSFSEF